MTHIDNMPVYEIIPHVFEKIFDLFKITCPDTPFILYMATNPFHYTIDTCCEIIRYTVENSTDEDILTLHNQTMGQLQIQYLKRHITRAERETYIHYLNTMNSLINHLKKENITNMIGHINETELVFVLLPNYFSKTSTII